MNRREWLAALAAASIQPARSEEAARVETEVVRLRLKHTWTTTMSSSESRDTLHVRYIREGMTGRGEGAPISRYRENASDAKKAIDAEAEFLRRGDPWQFDRLLDTLFERIEGQYAAKSGVDIAMLDWITQKLGLPLYRYFGLDPSAAPLTTFSIGIDDPETTRRKVREAAPYPVLKIKVGLDSDESTINAVRDVTDKPLRVDANEGWKDKDTAASKIDWLVKRGVELVEQPLPAALLEETRWLRDRFEVPIFADEAVVDARDIPRLAEAYDGVNIKLDKCGGVRQAYRMIHMARALGLKTMLGCMVSSSVAVTAAAHLSPLVDYADLDGNLLISNDPFRGVRVVDGRLILPSGPGFGLTPTGA